MIENLLLKRRVRGGLLIVWMLVIFGFSSMPGVISPYASPLWYILERKGAHVAEFFILASLATAFFSTYVVFRKEKRSFFLLVIFFSVAYAFSDEIHQFFVFGREARFTDVLIDSGGALLGTTISFFWWRKKIHHRVLRWCYSLKTKTSR